MANAPAANGVRRAIFRDSTPTAKAASAMTLGASRSASWYVPIGTTMGISVTRKNR